MQPSSPNRYRRIPEISPGAYIFQRPFLRGLFLEALIFGGAYQRREICVSKSIVLSLQLEVNLLFWLCFTLYLRAILNQKPPGGLYLEGRFNGGFFALPVWGAYIWRGLYMEGLIFGILRYIVYLRLSLQGYKLFVYVRPNLQLHVSQHFQQAAQRLTTNHSLSYQGQT